MLTKIYVLKDSEGAVRYVGKTHYELSNRLARHMKEMRKGNYHRAYWIRQQAAEGRPISIELIEEVEGDGCERERFWIAEYRRMGIKLVNTTDGGEGIPGFKFSRESVAKIQAANKKHRSDPEYIKGLSDRAKERWHNQPEEVKERCRTRLKRQGEERKLRNQLKPKKVRVRLSKEERSRRQSEAIKKWHASMTEEQKAKRIQKYKESVSKRPPERTAEIWKRIVSNGDHSERAERVRRQWANRTQEEREAVGRKISASRLLAIKIRRERKQESELRQKTEAEQTATLGSVPAI